MAPALPLASETPIAVPQHAGMSMSEIGMNPVSLYHGMANKGGSDDTKS
jgi:hypothetical protein